MSDARRNAFAILSHWNANVVLWAGGLDHRWHQGCWCDPDRRRTRNAKRRGKQPLPRQM